MTAKPLKLKLTDEQLAWVEQAAADEGIDSATFVRMMIDRLSKGRAPLISQMAPVHPMEQGWMPEPIGPGPMYHGARIDVVDQLSPQFSDLATADAATVRAALDREPQREFDVNWEDAKETAAISLRKVEWNQYNPLPK